ncbi:MAG: hypothetical protein ISS28_07020 [Candidatus Cloacimonetes bacterium]|nr:hypothetical protein [Candidatus Cloacimonadota bacterium]MBL7086829.1 hypothetical protein [Candidatus Cloacimonadota bacterium]
MKFIITITTILIILFLIFGCSPKYKIENGKIKGIHSIEDLDKAAVFNFVIMSDNKGDSPMSSEQFTRMVEWCEDSNTQFVIGLGDHLKLKWENSFLAFLKQNNWWKEHFYPNIADGENEYYGTGQDDWGAGGKLLDEIELSKKDNVIIRENGCEYYAKIRIKNFTVHLVQLHFSDSPENERMAFNENSRKYFINTLQSINKGKKDIIIVAAHSRTGSWIHLLSDERKRLVMEKADLVLSATTHFFERVEVEGYENSGALCINTGSITFPAYWCPGGYVQVNVLKNPFALIVQYINADKKIREMQNSDYAFIKIVNNGIFETDFRPKSIEENPDRIIGVLEKDYTNEEMNIILKELYLKVTGADIALAEAFNGIKKGKVVYNNLWNICHYNNEIFSITLNDIQVKSLFGDIIPMNGKKEIEIAVNGYDGNYYIGVLKLDKDSYTKTGVKEVQVLEEWIKQKEE